MGSTVLINGDCCTQALRQYRNTPYLPWIIQKFGGTSVGKFSDNLVEEIVSPTLLNHRVAVVCSARSGSTKRRLLRAAREAENSKSDNYGDIIDFIKEDHIQAAHLLIKSPKIFKAISHEILEECQDLNMFLAAVQKVGEISPKSLDKIISFGEILSARFIAALLQDRGVDSQFINLSEIIVFPSGQVLDQQFYNNVATTLAGEMGKCGSRVPVLTGFFGPVPGGLLEQIGRGYTDLCAALAAVGVEADELQVWKDISGVFTADPRTVPTARLISNLSPIEAAELTFYGSEVIHPFTMQQVIQASIPIRIKNVANPRGSGTLISPEVPGILSPSISSPGSKLFRMRSASLLSEDQRPKRPTALTIKHKILVINVHSNKRTLSHGFFAKIFLTLDKWRLSIDLISTSEVHVSMALHSESALVAGTDDGDNREIVDDDLRGAIEELRGYGTVDIIDGMAILSLVGKQMKNMIGIAGKMFSTLGENNVNIEMISQGKKWSIRYNGGLGLNTAIGASEINISCVIEERDADRAINILHTNLFTFLD